MDNKNIVIPSPEASKFFRDQVAKGNELAEKSIFSSSEIEKISKHACEDCSDWIYT